MKKILLLSGDEYCMLLNGQHYLNETGFTQISRYLRVFDRLVVVFRTKQLQSSDELGKYKNKITDERVTFIDAPFFQGPKQIFLNYLKIYRKIKREMPKVDFAIFRLPSTIAFLTLKIINKRKIQYATEIVFDCHDAVVASETFISKFIWKLLHKMQVKACNNALGVACVTAHYLQQHYSPIKDNSITSHYSSIELTPDFFLSERKYPQKEIITLVHVANQVKYNSRKGHNQLIEVLSILNKKSKRARIVFIGEDYDNGINLLKEYAVKLNVLDDVRFTGFLTRTQLRKELEESDIAILPTKAEGLPRLVIEAMALGLPCITSPVSGNPELIDKDFLIKYDDVEGMAKACEMLISSKELYEQESRTNFKKSKEYSNIVLNARRDKFYKSLIQLISDQNNR